MAFSSFPHLSKGMRRASGLTLLVALAACGAEGGGCNGCNTGTPIPGGFPSAEALENGGQVRISQHGLEYLEKNFGPLIAAILGTETAFPITPSCQTATKVCCRGNSCEAKLDIKAVSITPREPGTIELLLSTEVKTNSIDVEQDLLISSKLCALEYDTADNPFPSTIGLDMAVELTVDDDGRLTVKRNSLTFRDFQCGDLEIYHPDCKLSNPPWWCITDACVLAEWVCPLFQTTLQNLVTSPVETAIDDLLQAVPLGLEARFPVASLLQGMTSSAGQLDYLVWAGGYGEVENGGVSAGALTGFRPVQHDPCVPDCSRPDVDCEVPQPTAIPRSSTFAGNTRPDGQPFQVGIGVHRVALEHTAYALYSSGGICIDISTYEMPTLNSGIFSLLVPSLNRITGNNVVPVRISVRPRKPPRLTLGKGTTREDSNGKEVIDEPLVRVSAEELVIGVYAMIDERYVRIFSAIGNLDMPLLMRADDQGRLIFVIGDLKEAFQDVRVEDSELLSEDPSELAAVFPTLVGIAGSFLGSGFDPIELPEIRGITLALDDGSVTSVDNNEMLAIFASLRIAAQNTSASGDLLAQPVETEAHIEKIELPPTRSFAVDARGDEAPSVEVAVEVGANELEWSYAVDGGLYHPWVRRRQLRITHPNFWLQGRHTLQIKARRRGQPHSTDPTPMTLPFVVDTVAPQVRLVRTASGLRAEIFDLVTPAEELRLEWRVDGAKVNGSMDGLSLTVRDDAQVRLRVRDTSGNTAELMTVPSTLEPPHAGGCRIGSRGAPWGWPLLALFALLAWRRRKSA